MSRSLLLTLLLLGGAFPDMMSDRFRFRELLLEAQTGTKMGQYARARAAIVEARAMKPNDPQTKALFEDLAGPEVIANVTEEIFFYRDGQPLTVRLAVNTNLPNAGGAWVKTLAVRISKDGKTVRTLGGDSLLASVVWDGKDERGGFAEDGLYEIGGEVRGKLGFAIPMKESRILVLGKKLDVMISVKEKLFAAGSESVTISTLHPDRSRVASWEVAVKNTAGKVVRSLKGGGLPPQIAWDGKTDEGVPAASGDVYTIVLKATGKNGKTLESNPEYAESEIPVITLPDGRLSFKMSTFSFATGKADLAPASDVLLSRVAALLAKYGWYSVSIEGHTDGVGSADANQALSLERARAVAGRLAALDPKTKARVTTAGFGASKPVGDNASEVGRAANRRVEFILTKIPLKG